MSSDKVLFAMASQLKFSFYTVNHSTTDVDAKAKHQ